MNVKLHHVPAWIFTAYGVLLGAAVLFVFAIAME